ncbi:hypothetical protein GOBAR_AA14410 [Gossypium barbadense]|uniref:ABC transmembrane type-1 domain-containing protein n=1 Tax=Gossypium barbadense TaxID=3634 RepID=A0A2P5XSA7_GOSBA|nr:hypothetical protein GOBAR_AA14410 [Gossypium barbadense]
MAPKAHELMHVQEETREVNVEALTFYMLFSYEDTLDWTLMALETFGSIIHGIAQPVGYLLLGKALNAFGDNISNIDAMVKALKIVDPFVWYMAFATFPAGVLEIGSWMYASERQMARLRLAFLKAMLDQEIGAYDTEITSGKIISAISYHMSIIQVVALTILVTGATYTKKMITISSTKTVYILKATSIVEQKAKGGDVITARMSILFDFVSLTFAAPDLKIFNQAKATGYEVFTVIRKKSIINYSSKGKKKVKKIDGNIEIQDVYFAYPSRPGKSTLEGFSLSIPTGTMVALVGCSGCKKSIIISLVERFYDPYKEEILIDNYNIKDLDLKFLRKNIGAVSQEPSLFVGTIKDNIKVGNMDASDQQVWDAAIMANAHTFVTQLLNQFSTEKQRIAIARAIINNPSILLLDEATSALIFELEELVQDALEKAMQGRTVILIGHRMSTIINADIIAVVRTDKATEFTEEFLTTNKQFSPLDIKEEETRYRKENHSESSSKEKKRRININIFFRILFGLGKRELAKIATSSIAAAFASVSKPVFHYYNGVVSEKAIGNHKRALYSAWFKKPKNNVGSLTSRVINDTSVVKTIIFDHMSVIVQCISSILIAMVVSMIVNWRMALVAWAVMPCHFTGGLIQVKSAKGFVGNSTVTQREVVALASEPTTNIRTIASFFHEEHILEKARMSVEEPMKRSRKERTKVALVEPSGAGKSSVLAILLRFYDPDQGRRHPNTKITRLP